MICNGQTTQVAQRYITSPSIQFQRRAEPNRGLNPIHLITPRRTMQADASNDAELFQR